MPIQTEFSIAGRNSAHVTNTSPAFIKTFEPVGGTQVAVYFDIVAREGAFSDSTIANYKANADSTIGRFLLNEISKRIPVFFKGELTTQYQGVTPKYLNFDIIYRADTDLQPREIINRIKALQSLCYPRSIIGLNPPLCTLHILNLYSLEVYVSQVLVNWHNQWDLDSGLPMGADISMTVYMHQYPTREEILCGAGFDSTRFAGKGYSGTYQDGNLLPTLTHEDPCVMGLLEANRSQKTATAGQSFRDAAQQVQSLVQRGKEGTTQ